MPSRPKQYQCLSNISLYSLYLPRSNPPEGTLHALFEKQTNRRIFCRRCADRTQPLIHHCCERAPEDRRKGRWWRLFGEEATRRGSSVYGREGEYQKRTRVREGCVSTPGRDITNQSPTLKNSGDAPPTLQACETASARKRILSRPNLTYLHIGRAHPIHAFLPRCQRVANQCCRTQH